VFFKRLFALILVAIAVPLLAFAVWMGAQLPVLLNADTYKNGLNEQNIYPDIVPVALPAMIEAINEDSPARNVPQDGRLTQVINRLSPEDWRAVATELVPPQWLQQQTETMLDTLFAYFNGETDTLNLTFDMTVFRDGLIGEEGQRAAARIVSAAPACTPDEITQLQAIASGSADENTLPICNPPDEYDETLSGVIQDTIESFGRGIEPTTLTLFEIPALSEDEPLPAPTSDESLLGLMWLRVFFQAWEGFVPLFYLCPAGLLALIVIIGVRSLKGFGQWVGWTGVLSGLLAMLPVFLLPLAILDGMAETLVARTGSAELDLFQVRLATGLVNSAFSEISGPVLAQAGLLLVAGIALLVIASVRRAEN